MATKITHFLHHNPVTGAQAVGTAFSLTAVHAHDLLADLPDSMRAVNFRGIINGLQIVLTSATSATKVTIRLCEDAAGDIVLVPDTEADLVAGITTASTKCAMFSVDMPMWQDLGGPGNGTLYLFAKVDNATSNPVFTGSECFWQE
jgi:hypothetical protein